MSNSKKTMLNVRKKMLAKDLKGIVNLPNYDDNQPVEITILPVEEEKPLSREESKAAWRKIDEIMAEVRNSPNFDPNMTLEDYRMERLAKKYESLN